MLKWWIWLAFFNPSGTRQLGDHRGPENWPDECPEARQTWGFHAEEKEMAFERLAQGKMLMKHLSEHYFRLKGRGCNPLRQINLLFESPN